MQMLLVKGRQDGHGRSQRSLVYRQRRYYRSEPHQDTYIRKTQDLWLLGPPQSGKTAAIERILCQAPQLWPMWPLLHCRATDPIGRWTDQSALTDHLLAQGVSWRTLGAEERIDALLDWAQHSKWVLVLDDAHVVSGRKLVLAVRLAQASRLVLMAALSEQALHPSLRTCLQRRAPQVIFFRSETPYDATLSLMWVMLILAMSAGWWELAAALGSTRGLAYGPLAMRQR
jgi:hypothetical protein